MASWSSQRVPSLSYPFVSILQRLSRVLERVSHVLLTYEVVLALRRLVRKYSPSLRLEWEVLLQLLGRCRAQTLAHPRSSLAEIVVDVLDCVEEVFFPAATATAAGTGTVAGQAAPELSVPVALPLGEEVLQLLVLYRSILPGPMLHRLMSHLHAQVHPSQPGWVQALQALVSTFFLHESIPATKQRALAVVEAVLWRHRVLYADLIVHAVVLGQVGKGAGDGEDVQIRQRKLELFAKSPTHEWIHRCQARFALAQKFELANDG
jgi:hypothetical protein